MYFKVIYCLKTLLPHLAADMTVNNAAAYGRGDRMILFANSHAASSGGNGIILFENKITAIGG